MKKAVVKLEVFVTCEVPDHIYAKDKAEASEYDMSESDIWHDYAVGAIHQSVETLHGNDQEKDWVQLYAEVTDCELEDRPDEE
jgi:hypothetical protein